VKGKVSQMDVLGLIFGLKVDQNVLELKVEVKISHK